MDIGKVPDPVTIALIFLIAVAFFDAFRKKLAETLLDLFLRPFRPLWGVIYRWIAPRIPFSISIRTYRKCVLRSDLTRMENPVGPTLEVPLEHAFAPLKLMSSTSHEKVDLFTFATANRRGMVLGGPGTGKTTLMKNLFTSVIKKRCHSELDDLIPVFVY